MSLIVFQHQHDEGPALIGEVLQNHGHQLRVIRLNENQPVPTDLDEVDGVISMGGPMNVDQRAQYPWIDGELDLIKAAHEAGKPIVGVCLGAQLLAVALGGKVAAMAKPEIGFGEVKLAFPGTIDPLYAGITWQTMQFHLHGQEVTELPKVAGVAPLASSKACRTQAFKAGYRSYGFQYHFEWDRKQIEHFARGDFARSNGVTVDQVIRDMDQHFDGYRRQAERLCERIAVTLMPIDKR